MALKQSEARAKERNRLRDTATPYQYADSLLDELRLASLRDMAIEVRGVDPNWYLARKVVTAFTEATDPQTLAYEFYKLPVDMAAIRWIERADGSFHYKLIQLPPNKQEVARFGGPVRGTLDVGGTTYNLPIVGSTQTFSVWGDKFRVIPPPTAAGWLWTVVYDRRPMPLESEDDYLDLPEEFEEACHLDTAIRALRTDGDESDAQLVKQLHGDPRTGEPGALGRARKALSMRPRRDMEYIAT